MEQLYIEALLIHWHTGLKFSSENRNPQIPEIGRKNWPIHPKQFLGCNGATALTGHRERL